MARGKGLSPHVKSRTGAAGSGQDLRQTIPAEYREISEHPHVLIPFSGLASYVKCEAPDAVVGVKIGLLVSEGQCGCFQTLCAQAACRAGGSSAENPVSGITATRVQITS